MIGRIAFIVAVSATVSATACNLLSDSGDCSNDGIDAVESGAIDRAATIRWAIFVGLTLCLYQKVRQMIRNIREKTSRTEVVPGFPSCPGAHWLVGHLSILRGGRDFDFVRGYRRVHCEYADAETGMASYWFFNIPVVSVLRGKDAKKIMLSSSYRRQTWLVNKHTRMFLGSSALLSLMKKDWRHYRNAVHKSFTSEIIKQSRLHIYQIGNTLVESLIQLQNQQEPSCLASQSFARARTPPVEDESSISDDEDEDDGYNGDKRNISSIKMCSPPLAQSSVVQEGSSDTDSTVLVVPLLKMAAIDVFAAVALRSNGVDFGCTRNLELSPIASAFDGLTMEFTRRLKRPWDPFSFLYGMPTRANRNYNKQRKLIRTFISTQISQTRARIARKQENRSRDDVGESSDQDERDLLTNLVNAADSEHAKAKQAGDEKFADAYHDEALGDVLMTLLFGGYDTTSISVSYGLYLLAKNPSKRAKCLAEVDAVLGNYEKVGGQLPPGLDELPYTKAVMLESLRLFPPAPSTTRTIEKPVAISINGSNRDSCGSADSENMSKSNTNTKTVTFGEGQMVVLPIWSIQRSELNYPRPNDMIPERWVRRKLQKGAGSDQNENSNCDSSASLWEVRPAHASYGGVDQNPEHRTTSYCRERTGSSGIKDEKELQDEAIPPANRDAFLAFAAGARNCVGKKLAMEEGVILLACLIHKLTFELISEDYEVSPSIVAVVQHPSDLLPMKVRARNLIQ
mmetsp:Transcript_18071/g.41471  ORF Transcript_18071/g.41471 Transcript_18071/m.41471 type:complete len:740 (-) Transcript_18071:183-2402(-)